VTNSQPEPDDERSEFERFEDAVRKIVKVPKSEVDAAIKKVKKERRGKGT
jgi:hypothetical protein